MMERDEVLPAQTAGKKTGVLTPASDVGFVAQRVYAASLC
jgi:hypothetical protein